MTQDRNIGRPVLLAAAFAGAAAARADDAWHTPLKDVAAGPGTLDIGGSLRTRFETQDGFDVLGYGTSDPEILLFRTRLSLAYGVRDAARAFVELQDARYALSRLRLSDFPGSSTYRDDLDLRQANLEWRRIGGSPFGLKLGRQILTYADRRLFAPAEWGNVGNYWWDAARLSFEGDVVQLDALIGRRVLSEPRDWNVDHHPWHMGALYARFPGAPITLDAFHVVKHDDSGRVQGERGTGDETRHTTGIFAQRPAGDGWDFTLFLAGQYGRRAGDAIRAFGSILTGGYTVDAPWEPRIGAELNLASGDRDPHDGVHGTFDGVFGAMDIPYGWMNVVSWKNLQDYALNLSVRPSQSLRFSVEYHVFRLSESRDAWYWVSGRTERRDLDGRAGRDLGHELDVILRWTIAKELEALVGYARFFAGSYVQRTEGASADANWAFAQLTYAF